MNRVAASSSERSPRQVAVEIFMTVTAKLLKLFRVDQQLRGLKTRLNAAERFLSHSFSIASPPTFVKVSDAA